MDSGEHRCFLKEVFCLPAWGIGPDGRVCFLNPYAENLLGTRSEEVIGLPAEELVERIASESEAENDDSRAVEVEGRDGKSRWILLLPLGPMECNGGLGCRVEVAVDINRWARIETYVKNLAEMESQETAFAGEGLTPRQRDVLALLAEGLDQQEVARRLHVSYTTVRTHVKNILSKLGVGSIRAAVAKFLLD